MKIAVVGYGVVGSGVVEVLDTNRKQVSEKAGQNIDVKYVMDLRDFPGDPVEPLIVKDFNIIENDPEIKIVVEAIGGETIAYDFAKRALLSGKHVCTPNKALIAKHGAELMALAKKHGVSLLFEASVGGGIPLIRPYCDALLTDQVLSVSGMLNGTSNYILTQMSVNGTSYEKALKDAQGLGYAEQDPTADVGGFDACRKLAIMLSLTAGKQVDYENIKTEGIQNIGEEDFAFANAHGFTLKQLVTGKIRETGVEALTAPFLIPLGHPLASVNDVYNAFYVNAKTTGDTMFYGRGAGKLPTASAVVSNIVDAATGRYVMRDWSAEKATILSANDYVYRKMIRVSCENTAVFKDSITIEKYPGQAAFLTPAESETETAKRLEQIKNIPGFKLTECVLRVYDA